MGIFVWLEETALAEWVRVSLVGYPLVITLHSIGMAIMVGLVFVIDLRLLGRFSGIPFSSLARLMHYAWAGFIVNFISGAVIFTTQAAAYVVNVQFLLKLAMVIAGAIIAGFLQPILRSEAASWEGGAPVPGMVPALGMLSIVMWVGTIVTGRFIAYLG